jgi:hypothetical protein
MNALSALLLVGVLASAALAKPTCLSNHDFNGPARGGRARSDQMLGVYKENKWTGHLLCESGLLPDGRVVRVKTEMQHGKIGFGTGFQSANPHGVILFNLNKVNGVSLGPDDANKKDGNITINPEKKWQDQLICGDGSGGSYWQFDKGMSIINSLAGGTKLIGYAFKNDADKATLLAGEELFSVDGSMLGCKLEVVVEMPVPATGDMTFDVQVKVEIDATAKRPNKEPEYNAGLKLNNLAEDIEITTDQETAAKMRNNTINGSSVILSMSKGLVCKKTKQKVAASEITITGVAEWDPAKGGNTFGYTVKRATIVNCESLYWDPTMAPFGGYEIVSAGSKTFPGFMALAMASVAAVVLGKQL